MRAQPLRPLLRLLTPTVERCGANQTRRLHKTRPPPAIPQPRPFVPDVHTFLTLVGRGLSKYSSKFPTWESLFSLTTTELKELGIEPPRTRRYLLQWLQRYRAGALGPGGDFEHVKDGEALLRVAMPPASVVSHARWVVNVPHDEPEAAENAQQSVPSTLPRPSGYLVQGSRSIVGPFARPLPDHGGAVVNVTEGMWEQQRGRKIDGGERRRTEVRFKKRSAARRAEREADMLSNM
ncbi:hypothetical protein G6O67_002349 [Ophiocordyceps sinensis]|uniref:Small ribosomal subunit protein mS41 n=1 Tax=Ophiocordyceps sinensis TaxID=72228 RepID=A0A8H4V766_9HYPO|nr:hypothetical protein G6O67_002349 [Ophiocordyceps sinensis]